MSSIDSRGPKLQSLILNVKFSVHSGSEVLLQSYDTAYCFGYPRGFAGDSFWGLEVLFGLVGFWFWGFGLLRASPKSSVKGALQSSKVFLGSMPVFGRSL